MGKKAVLEKIAGLGDLDLAILVSLVTGEHCIVRTQRGSIHATGDELSKTSRSLFNLSTARVVCNGQVTAEEFVDSLVGGASGTPYDCQQLSASSTDNVPSEDIANVVVVENLDLAPYNVQIQALELIRRRRVLSRSSLFTVPTPFLFIALLSSAEDGKLIPQLNECFSICHLHEPDDMESIRDDQAWQYGGSIASAPSIIQSVSDKGTILNHGAGAEHALSLKDINTLSEGRSNVHLSPEVRQYAHNLIVFLRMHRAVARGVSASATSQLLKLAQGLATLHGISYATPALVALATRKVYPHRIVISKPEEERSVQWGSSVEAVAEILRDVTPEDVIEDVLRTVAVPV